MTDMMISFPTYLNMIYELTKQASIESARSSSILWHTILRNERQQIDHA
jgi:hypothetical protein